MHSYSEFRGPAVAPTRSLRLTRDAFQCDVKRQSLPFEEIKQGGNSPPWYSKGADDAGQPVADLALASEALKGFAFRDLVVANAWLGAIVSHQHRFVMQRVSGGPWLFPLRHFSESSAMVWPAAERKAPNDESKSYFVPMSDLDSPMLVVVHDWDEWRAAKIQVLCPAAQHQECAASRDSWTLVGMRFFQASDIQPMKELAARSAFWNLNKTFLLKLGEVLGVPLLEGSSLVNIIWALVAKILPAASDDLIRSYVEQRLVTMAAAVEANDAEQYGEVEELSDVLEVRDEKHAKKQVENHEDDKFVLEQARADFVFKVSGNPWGGKLGKLVNSEGKRYPKSVPPGQISHSVAKSMAPPSSYVWRHTKEGRWCGRMPPYGEVSRSWAKHGERQALILVLQSLWESFLTSNGATAKMCPIAGLLST